MVFRQVCEQDKENPKIWKKKKRKKEKCMGTGTEYPFTAQTERQDKTYSGNNFRTVVVRIAVKNDPLWTDRKCERKRRKLSLSAGMVIDSLCKSIKYSINGTTSNRWHTNQLVENFQTDIQYKQNIPASSVHKI